MIIAVDTETTGLNPFLGDRPFMISICKEDYSYITAEFPVDPFTRKVKHTIPLIINQLLIDPSIDKVFHNCKFDLLMLKSIGIEVKGKIHDTFSMARCCCSSEKNYKLKYLADRYVEIPNTDEQDLKKQVTKYRKLAEGKGFSLREKPEEDYWLPKTMGATENLCKIYCETDVLRTLKLYEFYSEGLKELGVQKIYELEIEVIQCLIEMQSRGVVLDKKLAFLLLYECYKNRKDFTESIPVNINSPKQLSNYLYNTLGLTPIFYTETGQPSTDNTALVFYENVPQVNAVRTHRAYSYAINNIQDYICTSDENELIHADIHNMGAPTGRFSCSNPNLYGVSDPETSGGYSVVDLRQLFRPRNGYVWITYDFKQLQLRIFADVAKERKMIDAFLSGRDIHDETRRRIKVFADLPEKQGRKVAKNTNFLKIFGGGAGTLNRKYGVPLDLAKIFLKAWDAEYPDIVNYIYKNTRIGASKGEIKTVFGRIIDVPPDRPYAATNYIVQGSEADFIKRNIVKLFKFFKENNLDIHLLLAPHDEFILEVNEKLIENMELLKNIKNLIEDTEGYFELPLPTDCFIIRRNWSEKTELNLNGITNQ